MQPRRQIIVYDKRAEAIARHKLFWFKTWGIDPNDRSFDVWRVEVRSGKKELKNKYRISQFSDFDASIGDVIVNSLNTVRYLADHQSDSNVTRQVLNPLWREAQAAAESNLLDLRSGLTPGQVREVIREHQIEIYWQQIQGNAAGLSVALGLEDSDIAASLPKLIGETLSERLSVDRSTFWDSRNRAAKKLVFL